MTYMYFWDEKNQCYTDFDDLAREAESVEILGAWD